VLDTGTTVNGVNVSGDFLRWVVSAILIIAISWLQIRGARLSAMFTNVLGVLMIIPLALMAVVGIFAWAKGGVPVQLPFMPEGQNLFGALSVGLFVVMWNYMGWELPSVAGDEIVQPKRTYPRAMALVLIAAIATYALPVAAGLYGGAGADGSWQLWGIEATNANIGIVSNFVDEQVLEADIQNAAETNGIPPEEVTLDQLTSPEVAEASAMIESWGADPAASTGWEFPQIGVAIANSIGKSGLAGFLGMILTISAVLSMIGLFIGNSLGGSRVPFALAEDGMFPRFMVKVHGKYGTPWVAILVVGVIFMIFSWSAFEFLVVADVFLQTLVILAEFAALWKLRFTEPDRPRQAVPGGTLGLVLVTLGPVAIIALAIVSQYMDAGFSSIGWALAFMAIGAVLYYPFKRFLKPGVPDINPYNSGDSLSNG
jgi:amino acid transporter